MARTHKLPREKISPSGRRYLQVSTCAVAIFLLNHVSLQLQRAFAEQLILSPNPDCVDSTRTLSKESARMPTLTLLSSSSSFSPHDLTTTLLTLHCSSRMLLPMVRVVVLFPLSSSRLNSQRTLVERADDNMTRAYLQRANKSFTCQITIDKSAVHNKRARPSDPTEEG